MKPVKYLRIILFFLISSNMLITSSLAQNSPAFKEGFYFGGMIVSNTVSGDFNDSSFFYTDTDAFNVPTLEDGQGFSIVMGSRLAKGSFEFGYCRTNHDVTSTFDDVGDKAVYSALDFDFKLDLIPGKESRIRPYGLLGIGLAWVEIEDNSISVVDMQMHDETFSGVCINLGAGLSYYINPRLAITGGIKYRLNTFGSVEGVHLEEDIDAQIIDASVGVIFTL